MIVYWIIMRISISATNLYYENKRSNEEYMVFSASFILFKSFFYRICSEQCILL